MPGLRSLDWLKLCFALALLPMLSAAALACPLCYEAARQMMTEGVRLDMADRAVLATPIAGANRYRIVAVVKGEDAVDGDVAEPVVGVDAAAPDDNPSLLIRDSVASQWTSLGTMPLEDAEWLRRIVATREVAGDRPRRTWPLTMSTADALSYSGWRQRVALVLPYLESANPLAARVAWGELARAPYVALDAARSRVDPATVAAWLDDPKLTSRYATYVTLLGFVGGEAETVRLEQRIEAAAASHDAKSLAAMIGADLELRGPSRVDWIETRYFADRSRTMPEIEAALLALYVHGDADRAVPRARVIQAFRTFIKQRPAMAGFVAPQLADWGCWDEVSDYSAIVRSNPDMDPASQFAINIYLKRASEAGVAGR
jgi:hypothetical protein